MPSGEVGREFGGFDEGKVERGDRTVKAGEGSGVRGG